MLRLPGEIRNRIYYFTLGGNTWHIDDRRKLTCKTPKSERNDHRALLRVCRQIYDEARLLPWSLSDFQCWQGIHLRDWLIDFPNECRRAITTITVYATPTASILPLDSIPTVSLFLPRRALGFQDFPALSKLCRHYDHDSAGDHKHHLQLKTLFEESESRSTEEKVRVVFAQPYTPEQERQRRAFSFTGLSQL